MKRIGKKYPIIISKENCIRSIIEASKKKRRRTNVQAIYKDRERKAEQLMKILQDFTPSKYREVIRKEGAKQKERHILVPEFWPDQCVQHAVIDPLRRELMNRFYYWSCANLPGRGNAHARKGVERATLHDPKHAKYCLQMDVIHCYESIKPDAMVKVLHQYIKDKQSIKLLEKIIRSCDGLPIGNYSSPWLCNLYLDRLDRYITQTIKPSHYVRYADDIVLLDANKRKLTKAEKQIRSFALDTLNLKLHNGSCVFKVRRENESPKHDNRAIDFIGYRYCIGYTVLRRSNALTIMRHSKRIQNALTFGKPISFKMASGFISRVAQLQHCKSYGLRKKYVDPIQMKVLKGVIRSESKRQQLPRNDVFS